MNYLKNKKGVTFIELLIYIGIFLVLVPVLVGVSINSARQQRQFNVEKQQNTDSQFIIQRVNHLIANAKSIDAQNSNFDEQDGKLTLVMHDDSEVVIERDPGNNQVLITEDDQIDAISADDSVVTALYFERIEDNLNDPDIVLGVTARINIKGAAEQDQVQDYVSSVNLERGDYDNDGCPDYKDKFPRHADCCGDVDDDGICDEKDNCVLEYNPFQEDFDEDEIGDECDDEVYLGEGSGGGGGGGGGAFNCSPDEQLINLIDQDPPLSSSQLKQILMSSSPLPPAVLNHITDVDPLNDTHYRQVFVANVKLTDEVYNNMQSSSNVSGFSKFIIGAAHFLADYIPWLGSEPDSSEYDINHEEIQCGESSDTAKIKFYGSSDELPESSGSQVADIFVVNVLNGTETVNITTTSNSGVVTETLNGGGSSIVNSDGFAVTLESINGNNYAFTITNTDNDNPLQSVEFDFGCGAVVNSPSAQENYSINRYVSYCEGGCDTDCGDVGTGILTDHIYTDRCYQWNWYYPEWCSKWYTFGDTDSENPAFTGGTDPGEGNVYWEKTFKTVLTQLQLSELKSITITGEVAYQRTAQFFCDTLESECPIDGSLINSQNVELYNWDTESWDVVGEMGLDGATSDQQIFEVKYDDVDVQKYVGGEDNSLIQGRIQFHWNGVPPEGETSAAAFMLIDYFTVHLKW